MNKIQETYLELLRAAIWSNELTSEGVKEIIVRDESRKELTNEQVNEIIRLAVIQGTGPLVFDQLLKLTDVDIPDAMRMQMKQQCMMSMMQQNAMMPILVQAWKALTEAGIDPVLLKGFGLAQYYPQPHLRQWGDMDVYVGQKNYHLGCETLRAAFPGVKHMTEEGEDYKHYNFEFGNAVLEMHRVSMTFAHPIDRRYYEKWEKQSLTKNGPKIEVGDLTITVPEDTFNVFFTFLHAWHHFIDTGMSMKQMSDIAVILHAKQDVLNRESLQDALKRLHLMEVWQQIMYIIVQHLGLSQNECPFYTDKCAKRAELLLERIMKEGSMRSHKKLNTDGLSYLNRKWITFQSRIADSKFVKHYAPKYAHHMLISAIYHGIERTFKGK